ncbi:hypothetical protein [Pseudovibrio exalbescens]|uniref:Glycosyl transferases group 1 n=1 Tax=Pseudovibrio exalbescens TaxID=197461 RepID=A0A1U7JK25_9HYPH|nr:hypothetical protein [Pseudovibrio exalbescens]OKL45044.1 hypothetical protein A3843_04640 [Pseudovibrio exalbescens]
MVKMLVVQTGLSDKNANAHPERRALFSLFKGYNLCFLTDAPVGAPPVRTLNAEVRGLATPDRLNLLAKHHLPTFAGQIRRFVDRAAFGGLAQDLSAVWEPLTKALSRFRLGPNDHILIPDCHLGLLHAVTQYYQKFGEDKLPRLHLRFRCPKDPNNYLKGFGQKEALSSLVWSGKIALYTETEEHLFVLRAELPMPVAGAMVLPRRVSPFDPPVPHQPALPGTAPLVIGLLGKTDRGDGPPPPDLEAILSHLARLTVLRRSSQAFHFLVAASEKDRRTGIFRDLAREGRFGDQVTVEFLSTPMSSSTYSEGLARADALLVPTQPGAHEVTGVDLVLDGVFGGRPIVHTAHMAPQRFLNSQNGLPALSEREFAEALCVLWTHFDHYRAGAERMRILATQCLQPAARHRVFDRVPDRVPTNAIPLRPSVVISSRPEGPGAGFIGLGR